jgi:hypothetical protein
MYALVYLVKIATCHPPAEIIIRQSNRRRLTDVRPLPWTGTTFPTTPNARHAAVQDVGSTMANWCQPQTFQMNTNPESRG